MDFSSEQKWPNGPSSSSSSAAVLIGEPTHTQNNSGTIQHYFIFSLFSAICLCPATGLIALAYSIKSSAKADVKFHDKARLYARRALIWNIISIVCAVLITILMMVYFYMLTDMIMRYQTTLNQQRQSADVNRFYQPVVTN